MMVRILTSLYMLPFLYIIHLGGIPMYLASLFLMLQGMKEYREALENKINVVSKKVLDSIVILLFIANLYSTKIGLSSYGMFFVYVILILLIDILKSMKAKTCSKNRLFFWLGVFYIIIGFQTIVWIRNIMPNGEFFTWLIFIITIVSDSMAYFTGKLFGSHKLIPSVSPNKTVEGSIGAVFFTVIACLLYGVFLNIEIWQLIAIGIFGSVFSQIGDLIASKLKRYAGIKDFSNLIPQHGGILDRLDSALLVSQFIFVVMLFLILV